MKLGHGEPKLQVMNVVNGETKLKISNGSESQLSFLLSAHSDGPRRQECAHIYKQ